MTRSHDLETVGWLPWTALGLCVLGLADSGYQVYTHFTGTGLLGCSTKADACELVQNSVYAWVFGVPVAVYGAVFFAFMTAVCAPWAWRSRLRLIRQARTAAVVIGMVFVLYLIYRELISLGQICPYCTSVHIITFLLFGLLVYDATGTRAGQEEQGTTSHRADWARQAVPGQPKPPGRRD